MDPEFLGAFSKIVAVDIDPFARWIFRARFRRLFRKKNIALEWDARDYLSPGEHGFSLDAFRGLLAAHPNAVLTPHVAGLTTECAERMAVSSVQNALDFFNGCIDQTLVVNRDALKASA